MKRPSETDIFNFKGNCEIPNQHVSLCLGARLVPLHFQLTISKMKETNLRFLEDSWNSM